MPPSRTLGNGNLLLLPVRNPTVLTRPRTHLSCLSSHHRIRLLLHDYARCRSNFNKVAACAGSVHRIGRIPLIIPTQEHGVLSTTHSMSLATFPGHCVTNLYYTRSTPRCPRKDLSVRKWLVQAVHHRRRDFCKVGLPTSFRQKTCRHAKLACSQAVDIEDCSWLWNGLNISVIDRRAHQIYPHIWISKKTPATLAGLQAQKKA